MSEEESAGTGSLLGRDLGRGGGEEGTAWQERQDSPSVASGLHLGTLSGTCWLTTA